MGAAPSFTLIVGLAAALPVQAATFEGRLALEMEYLGESYYSEQSLTAEDLGLPPDTPLVLAETTRFEDGSWHPGPRLDLAWRGGSGGRTREITSHTAFNSERFSQELEIIGVHPASAGRWRWRAHGGFRDEPRSLVGEGDWRAGVEASRQARLGRGLEGELRASWEHSRSRGDTMSYLYDYELARTRLRVGDADVWSPSWESYVEGTIKSVPSGAPGAYAEVRVVGEWRSGGTGGLLTANLCVRDYRLDDSPGRDVRRAELEGRARLRTRPSSRLELEAGLEASDFSGEDALYFDSAELALYVPWSRDAGGWTLAGGPAASRLQDLGGGGRDYTQWTARGTLSRFFRLTGFGELHLETGYRDYRGGAAATVEVTSLSASILRSDYWLVDALLTLSLPVRNGISVESLASTSWEFHPAETERIQITLVTLGVARTF